VYVRAATIIALRAAIRARSNSKIGVLIATCAKKKCKNRCEKYMIYCKSWLAAFCTLRRVCVRVCAIVVDLCSWWSTAARSVMRLQVIFWANKNRCRRNPRLETTLLVQNIIIGCVSMRVHCLLYYYTQAHTLALGVTPFIIYTLSRS
jgi:hypothetical protein